MNLDGQAIACRASEYTRSQIDAIERTIQNEFIRGYVDGLRQGPMSDVYQINNTPDNRAYIAGWKLARA